MNAQELRMVLLVRAWQYLHRDGTPPANSDWQEINREATTRALQKHKIRATVPLIQREMRARHVEAVVRAGGYLSLQAACAYRAWRLGQDSVTVAESLGVSPCAARVILQRLRDIARELGFDVGAPHHSFRNVRHSAALKAAWISRKAQPTVLQGDAA
jgi:hypothetical protein